MTRWEWYWAAWIVVGFMVPETWALLTKPKNTLSDTVWSWFGVKTGVPIWQWNVLHISLLMFLVWLAGHMAFRVDVPGLAGRPYGVPHLAVERKKVRPWP